MPPLNTTAKYPGSKVKYFRLQQTFVGCSVIAAGAVQLPVGGLPTTAVPQACEVVFRGVNKRGKRIEQFCPYTGPPITTGLQACVFGDGFRDGVAVSVNCGAGCGDEVVDCFCVG